MYRCMHHWCPVDVACDCWVGTTTVLERSQGWQLDRSARRTSHVLPTTRQNNNDKQTRLDFFYCVLCALSFHV